MKLEGNVTVMVSEMTSALCNVNPIVIRRLPAATRSAAAMVSIGTDTMPPMVPVAVAVLLQSRVVETENIMVDATGGPIVIAVNVSVYVPIGATAAAVTAKEVRPTVAPGVVKMAAGV